MKTNIKKTKTDKKFIYKLLNDFNERELFAVKQFAEFVKKFNGDDKLMQILLNAPFEEKMLSEKTRKNLEKADHDIQKDRYRPLYDVMKDYGL